MYSVDSQPDFGKPEIRPSELAIDEGRKLGKGQFGHVYAGKCRGLEVAIKVLKTEDEDQARVCNALHIVCN
jgi:hypothetical protein